MAPLRARWLVVLFLPFFGWFAPAQSPAGARPDPNFLVDISREFLGAALEQTIDRVDPVNDVVLKARISGTGHVTAKVGVELVANDEMAIVDLVTKGTILANTVGVRGPVQVYTDSNVPFQIRQRVYLRPEGITTACPQAQADGDTTLTGITTDFHCVMDRVLKKIACKQFYKSQDKAQAISKQRVEEQLNESSSAEAGPKLQEADQQLKKNLQDLRDKGIQFALLRFSSTLDALLVRANVQGAKTVAFGLPPELVQHPYLALRVHESMINETAQVSFGGKTLTGEELEKQSKRVGQKQAPMPKEDKEFSVTFVKDKPLEMTFAKQGLQAVFRLAEFSSGEDDYTGMDMTVQYKFVSEGDKVKAVRQGPIEAFPPNFKLGQKLSGRQQVMRTVLQKRFGKFFKEEMILEDMELEGDLKKAGPLMVTGAQAERGWLTMTWRKRM
jgi:hypothetical protein